MAAAVLLNLAGDDAQFARSRCSISGGILIKLMKVILFAFMEHGYISAREIRKLCKTDIRFLWLLDGTPAPSHMTIANFIKTDFVKDNFIH